MLRLSPLIEKIESKYEARFEKHKKKIKGKIPLILIGLYFYGVFVNSIRLGIASTFPKPGAPPVESIWVWNPVLSYAALFSIEALAVTLFLLLMFCLVTKKGYYLMSGEKIERDKRGFDILKHGTHGTGGWMKPQQMETVLDTGIPEELNGTVLGKLKEDAGEDDKYATYVATKAKHTLNDHMLVYGATGAGKSRGFVKPFILQAARRMESLVLVDPKGELYETTSEYMREKGYIVRAYNLLDLENSDGYNCIHDIAEDPELVPTIAEIIIKNTSNAKDRQNFWENAEKNLLSSLIYYMGSACDDSGNLLPIEERSLGEIYKLLCNESFAQISKRIDKLPGGHPARQPFGLIHDIPIQNRSNVVLGLGNRLGVFQNKMVDCITKYNDIDLTLPGQKPCCYYCIISDQDGSLEFLSSMFFSLLFWRLSKYARRYGENGRLKTKVNILLEEFSNIGHLSDFLRIISVIRSRNIACQLVVQSAAQLSDRYPGNQWEEIISNIDWQLFLGCNDIMTAQYISKQCGMVTIKTESSQSPQTPLFSPVNSNSRYSRTSSSTQRPLMMPDELLRMDRSKSILLVGGQKPLELYKITPEEIPGFDRLKATRVTDHIPAWREIEAERERSGKNEVKERRFGAMESDAAGAQTVISYTGKQKKHENSKDSAQTHIVGWLDNDVYPDGVSSQAPPQETEQRSKQPASSEKQPKQSSGFSADRHNGHMEGRDKVHTDSDTKGAVDSGLLIAQKDNRPDKCASGDRR